MHDREAILVQIRKLAAERGGKLGYRAFVEETGIPERYFTGTYWATWSEALKEARVGTNDFFRPSFPEQAVASSMATLIARLGKWPTQAEIKLARQTDPTFPSMSVFRRLDALGTNLPALIVAHCGDRADLALVAKIALARQRDGVPEEDARDERARVQGHVYMSRAGPHYKIGFSNSPTRRHREVSLNLPVPTSQVHSIETDDPRGIEHYWHRRFSAKRVKGTEFFKLTADDVRAFKRRKYQ